MTEIDVHEERIRISIEVKEIQQKLQQNKTEEQQLIEELLKRKGQLEFLENLNTTTTIEDTVSNEEEE